MLKEIETLKLGVIGCGWIMKLAHIPAFKEIPYIQIRALFDTDVTKLQLPNVDMKSIKITNDLVDFFSEDLDAVLIGTPNYLHSFYAREALERNIHVLVEKPIGLVSIETKRLIELSKKKRLIYLPAYVNRYREDVKLVCEKINKGAIGEVVSIDAKWLRKNGIPRVGGWNTNQRLSGGGVLQDLGPHIIDLCTLFAKEGQINYSIAKFGTSTEWKENKASWITDCKTHDIFDVETWVKAEFGFVNDVKVVMYLDWAADIEGDYTEFVIFGTKGKIILHTLFGFSNNFSKTDQKTVIIQNDDGSTTIKVDNVCSQKAFCEQAKYFTKCVVNRKYEQMDCECGYYAVDIIEQLYHQKMQFST